MLIYISVHAFIFYLLNEKKKLYDNYTKVELKILYEYLIEGNRRIPEEFALFHLIF